MGASGASGTQTAADAGVPSDQDLSGLGVVGQSTLVGVFQGLTHRHTQGGKKVNIALCTFLSMKPLYCKPTTH